MANTKVTAKVIADGTITATQLASDSITSAKIADDVALGGNPTTTTQSAGNNTTRIATTAFVSTAITNLIDSSPSALNTLNELAAALGDDENFSTTVTDSIATKLTASGANQTLSDSGTFTLDAANEIILDSDAEIIRLYHDGGNIGVFQMTGNDFIIRSMVADKDIIFKGNDSDGGGTITALTLDMSNAGAASFGGQIITPSSGLIQTASSAGSLTISGGNTNQGGQIVLKGGNGDSDIKFNAQASTATPLTRMHITNGGLVGIGRTPAFASLEIEGDKTTSNNLQLQLNGATNTNKQMILGYDTTADKTFIINQIAGSAPVPFNIQASAVGIGNANFTPTEELHVNSTTSGQHTRIHVTKTSTAGTAGISFNTTSSANTWTLFQEDASASKFYVYDGANYIGTFDSANNRFGVNNQSPSQALDVSGNFYLSGDSTVNGTTHTKGYYDSSISATYVKSDYPARGLVGDVFHTYAHYDTSWNASTETKDIFETSHDSANWGNKFIIIEIFQTQYDGGGYARYYLNHQYNQNSLVEIEKSGRNTISTVQMTSLTTVSGNIKKSTFQVVMGYYQQAIVRVTSNMTASSSINAANQLRFL